MRGPGGSLIASLNKHNAPITHVLSLSPFFITLSINKIHVCKIMKKDELRSLFEISLIGQNKDQRVEYNSIKPIKLEESTNKENNETAENFPLNFCLISKKSVTIIASNRDVKFNYSTNTEILDAFCICQKQLIIVEKDKRTIKLYSNYILKPTQFIDAKISDNQKIINSCARNTIEHSLSSISFYIILEDLSFKKITITANIVQYGSLKFENEINMFNEKYISTEASCQSISNFYFFDKFKIQFEDNFLPKFTKLATIVKQDFGEFSTLEFGYQSSDIDSYISTTDGHFVVANELYEKKETRMLVFMNSIQEPIKMIRTSIKSKLSLFILLSENHMYIVHKNRDCDQEFCFIKFDGKFHFVSVWSDNSILVARNNLVEVYRIKCLKNTHQIKTVLSFYAHTDDIYNIVRTGRI